MRDFVLCGPTPCPAMRWKSATTTARCCPSGEVGRIFASGGGMMQAYFGRASETAAVLDADGWLDAGDLGYVQDGQIVITGRAKDPDDRQRDLATSGRRTWNGPPGWPASPGCGRATWRCSLSTARPARRSWCWSSARRPSPVAREAMREEISRLIRIRHGTSVKVICRHLHSIPQTSSGKIEPLKTKALYLSGKFDLPAGP